MTSLTGTYSQIPVQAYLTKKAKQHLHIIECHFKHGLNPKAISELTLIPVTEITKTIEQEKRNIAEAKEFEVRLDKMEGVELMPYVGDLSTQIITYAAIIERLVCESFDVTPYELKTTKIRGWDATDFKNTNISLARTVFVNILFQSDIKASDIGVLFPNSSRFLPYTYIRRYKSSKLNKQFILKYDEIKHNANIQFCDIYKKQFTR